MVARMDDLEKEVEEGRVALKASQSWTNHWADQIKEVGAESASYCEDWLNLSSQQLDFRANIRANSQTIAAMETWMVQQETMIANLVQWLEQAKVGVIDHIY